MHPIIISQHKLQHAYKKFVDESHISAQEHFRKNAFLYLMEDVDESSSENNISGYWYY